MAEDTNDGSPAAKRRLTRLRKAVPGPNDVASPSIPADAALDDSQTTRASDDSARGAGGSGDSDSVSSSSEDEGSDASDWDVHVPEGIGSSSVTLHMVHWGAGLGHLQASQLAVPAQECSFHHYVKRITPSFSADRAVSRHPREDSC